MILQAKRMLVILLLAAAAPALFAGEKMMSIQVRQGQLRSAPSYLSRVIENVGYASRVSIIEEKGDWMRVRIPGSSKEGWMHSSTLSEKKIKLSSGTGNATTAVSSDEQALAGKGFSSDVEAKFKQDNSKIDFTWVDKMEKIKIPPPVLVKFLKEGDIKAPRGGAQ